MAIALHPIRIVLVEPAGALNVGSVARVMKNMGLSQLVLVNPQCDPLGHEARQMAVHAADVLEAAIRVASLPEALQGCQRAIATTGRDRTTLNIDLEAPRTALPWLLSDPHSPVATALIFGREDSGLTNTELNYAQRFIRIPSTDAYASLNLAQAVAICCYELSLCAAQPIEPAPLPAVPLAGDLAALDALEGFYNDLEALLLTIGYLYPHTAPSRMKKLRRLFHRAYPSDSEVAMLRGMVSQMKWALQKTALK